MRKIVLLCSAGMSTNLLVTKMRASAKEQNYDVEIDAYSVSEASREAADADLVLLGPQVRFNLSAIQKQLPGKPVDVIDMRSYGMMDGEAVIKQVKEILGD